MQKQKKELILVAVVLILAAAGFFINTIRHRQPAAYVEVTVDSKLTHRYDLNQNVDEVLEGYNGGTNHLIIENGVVWISEATCPDKVCIHQGRVSMNGELLVCLPNRLIVKIVAPEA